MSLVLKFRTPQSHEASSAGIGTNRRLPTMTSPTGASDWGGGTTARLNGKSRKACLVNGPAKGPDSTRHDACTTDPIGYPSQSPPLGSAIPGRKSKLRNYQ